MTTHQRHNGRQFSRRQDQFRSDEIASRFSQRPTFSFAAANMLQVLQQQQKRRAISSPKKKKKFVAVKLLPTSAAAATVMYIYCAKRSRVYLQLHISVYGWDRVKVSNPKGENSHSKCTSKPCLLLSERYLNPEIWL